MPETSALGDNLRRLMGLHALSARHLSALIGLSSQALSELMSGKRNPSLSTVHVLGHFFEIPLQRLLETPFDELLGQEIADRERFARVEARIHSLYMRPSASEVNE